MIFMTFVATLVIFVTFVAEIFVPWWPIFVANPRDLRAFVA